MHTTPISLLERLREPDRSQTSTADWGRFVDLYTPLLFYWACKLNLAEADAADLVQDVFVHLLHKLPGFQHDRQHRFRSWLRTVLLNRFRDRWRPRAAPPERPTGSR